MPTRITRSCFIGVLILAVASSACDPLGADKAAARIQQSIDELTRESRNWQNTITQLESDLVTRGLGNFEQAVEQVAQQSIDLAGTQVKCEVEDFIPKRLKGELERLRDRLKRKPASPLAQTFCAVSPKAIDFASPLEMRRQLDFYGYNLDASRVALFIVDKHDVARPVTNSQRYVTTPHPYLMVVDVSSQSGVRYDPTEDQKIRLVLNPGLVTEHTSEVAILAAPLPPMYTVVSNTAYDIPGGGGVTTPPVRLACPTGSVATDIQGRSGEFIDYIQLVCAPLNGDGSLGNFSSTQAAGGNGGDPFHETCGNGQVLVGMTGWSSGNLEQIGGQCNSVAAIVGAATGSVAPTVPSTTGRAHGSAFTRSCKSSYAVTGLVISAGGNPVLVSRMDFTCSEIQYKPTQ